AVRLGDQVSRPTIPWQQVEVYRTADQVPGDYDEVGLLITTASTIWTSEKGMWNSMKKKAAKLGANAIILDAVSEPSAGAKVAGAIFGVGVNRKGKAVAIFVHPKEK
ncbi:unnamed protein product, partial [marine sediment metagenome]